MIERHYLSLPDGQVHYLRAGSGAPVVLCHASPRSVISLLPWMDLLAERFTVFAMDTAGFGQSDPLSGDLAAAPEIEDYATRVLAFADAVGIEDFLVGGTHTGASIALAVATAAPDRIRQIVMDGLGIFTEEERAQLLACYTPPIRPDWWGGHLLEAWHRARNMSIFWPWYRQEAQWRVEQDMPPPERLHALTFDMLRARPDYGLAYRASFRYDALTNLRGTSLPRVVLARRGDPLHEQLPRIGSPMPGLEVHSVDTENYPDRVCAAFRDDLIATVDPPPPPQVQHTCGTSRRYVRTRYGATHVRVDGEPQAPPALVIHGSPGSANSLEPLIRELADDRLVIAPDINGTGYSEALQGSPAIEDFAQAIAAVLDELGHKAIEVYGCQVGACIAIELAAQRPDLVASVSVEGVPEWTEAQVEEIRASYFPDLTPQPYGEHLLRAFHLVRDTRLWWPFVDPRPAVSNREERADADSLHRSTLEILMSDGGYELPLRAALEYRSTERIEAVTVPLVVHQHICGEKEGS